MSNVFLRKTLRNVGTDVITSANVKIGGYTVGTGTSATVLGLVCANTINTDITVDVAHYDGANITYLVKNAPIQYGSSLVVIGGNQKVVLQTGDAIHVRSSQDMSVDVVMSLVELS